MKSDTNKKSPRFNGGLVGRIILAVITVGLSELFIRGIQSLSALLIRHRKPYEYKAYGEDKNSAMETSSGYDGQHAEQKGSKDAVLFGSTAPEQKAEKAEEAANFKELKTLVGNDYRPTIEEKKEDLAVFKMLKSVMPEFQGFSTNNKKKFFEAYGDALASNNDSLTASAALAAVEEAYSMTEISKPSFAGATAGLYAKFKESIKGSTPFIKQIYSDRYSLLCQCMEVGSAGIGTLNSLKNLMNDLAHINGIVPNFAEGTKETRQMFMKTYLEVALPRIVTDSANRVEDDGLRIDAIKKTCTALRIPVPSNELKLR